MSTAHPAQRAVDILTTSYPAKPNRVLPINVHDASFDSGKSLSNKVNRLAALKHNNFSNSHSPDGDNLSSQDECILSQDATQFSKFVYHHSFTFPDMRLVPLPLYLEQVTVLFLEACNVRSRKFMQAVVDRYVASALQVNKAEGFKSLSRNAYVRGKVDMWASNPTFRVHPRITTPYVDEANGRARIFSTNSVVGLIENRPELTRESVTVISFERRVSGEWLINRFDAIRGPGHWTFEVGHADAESPISDDGS